MCWQQSMHMQGTFVLCMQEYFAAASARRLRLKRQRSSRADFAMLCSCPACCRYTAAWQKHVLAHVPFYLCLFPVALELLTGTAPLSASQAYRHLQLIAEVRHLPMQMIGVLQLAQVRARRCLEVAFIYSL
jgi:hypothetical protein